MNSGLAEWLEPQSAEVVGPRNSPVLAGQPMARTHQMRFQCSLQVSSSGIAPIGPRAVERSTGIRIEEIVKEDPLKEFAGADGAAIGG